MSHIRGRAQTEVFEKTVLKEVFWPKLKKKQSTEKNCITRGFIQGGPKVGIQYIVHSIVLMVLLIH